jgi:hypothetical protein
MAPRRDRREHQTALLSGTIAGSGDSATSICGGTTEIMKEIIGRGPGL